MLFSKCFITNLKLPTMLENADKFQLSKFQIHILYSLLYKYILYIFYLYCECSRLQDPKVGTFKTCIHCVASKVPRCPLTGQLQSRLTELQSRNWSNCFTVVVFMLRIRPGKLFPAAEY